jgi:hypothetical protein
MVAATVQSATAPKNLYQRVMRRSAALDVEYEYCRPDWEDCSDFVLGSRGKFLTRDQGTTTAEQRHRGRNDLIYNERAKEAVKTLAAGMMAGITSPARPWFSLSTGDPDLDENAEVKMWLKETQSTMLMVLGKSNFYQTMYAMYQELGAFGTACMLAVDDFENIVRFEQWTVGTYRVGINSKRKVDTLYREFTLSLAAAAERFGLENLSPAMQQKHADGMDDIPVTVVHAIEPNDDRKFGSKVSKDFAFRSVYFEKAMNGADQRKDGDIQPLRESGFREQPFMCPRWSVTEEEAYASAWPGLDCLASNKGLQVEELDLAMAREKMHNPPLVGDSKLKQGGVNLIAGAINWLSQLSSAGSPGLAPVYQVKPDISALAEAIKDKEGRIDRAFYADLFLMMVESDRRQITATEVLERREEKLLMLGPVLERLSNELLDPVIDRVFDLCNRAGIIKPPPAALADRGGQPLEVEYVSVLAQAQKAISTAALESVAQFTSTLAMSAWPEAAAKFNAFEAIEDYAAAKGAAPDILLSDADAQKKVDEQAAQAQQAAAAEQAATAGGAMNDVAQAAQTASQTEVAGDPVLEQLLGGMGG